MQDRAKTSPQDSQGQMKAALLMALLGPEKMAALRAQGLAVTPPAAEGKSAPAGVTRQEAQEAARLLLAKLTAREGKVAQDKPRAKADIFEETYRAPAIAEKAQSPEVTPPPPAPRKIDRAALHRRLVDLVTSDSLAREHPAVIAHLLWPQDSFARADVLRALPGPVARAVLRSLRHLSEKS